MLLSHTLLKRFRTGHIRYLFGLTDPMADISVERFIGSFHELFRYMFGAYYMLCFGVVRGIRVKACLRLAENIHAGYSLRTFIETCVLVMLHRDTPLLLFLVDDAFLFFNAIISWPNAFVAFMAALLILLTMTSFIPAAIHISRPAFFALSIADHEKKPALFS